MSAEIPMNDDEVANGDRRLWCLCIVGSERPASWHDAATKDCPSRQVAHCDCRNGDCNVTLFRITNEDYWRGMYSEVPAGEDKKSWAISVRRNRGGTP